MSTREYRVQRWWRCFRASAEGANLVEYAILIALIVIVAVLAVSVIGPIVSSDFSEVGSGLL